MFHRGESTVVETEHVETEENPVSLSSSSGSESSSSEESSDGFDTKAVAVLSKRRESSFPPPDDTILYSHPLSNILHTRKMCSNKFVCKRNLSASY